MYSSGSGVAKGAVWKDELYFDPNAEGVDDPMSFDEMSLEDLNDKIDDTEKILKVWKYKKPLESGIGNHHFVVLRTATWWWSIEKDSENIVLRRSKTIQAVRDNDKGGARKRPIDIISHDEGGKSMAELIEFLYKNNELWNTYNLKNDNCQHFAERVFDFVKQGEDA